MYPPVGVGQLRISHTHDLVLCGGKLTIPSGTLLWVPHHGIQNVTANWDHPEKFQPGGLSSCLTMQPPNRVPLEFSFVRHYLTNAASMSINGMGQNIACGN